jgi:gas vesicle protein
MPDQVAKARSMVERVLDPALKDEFAKRGRAVSEAIGDAAGTASERAAATWHDAEPMRRQAAQAGREALRWSRRTWRKEMQPGISRLWSKRTVALGAAGAAVPVARELIDDAAIRMGLRARREQRHWGAFFIGLLIGAAGGVIAAVLTAPKAGRQMRDELAVTAKDAAIRAREVASRTRDEVTTRAREAAASAAASAREAAASAGEWVPIFQRPEISSEVDGEPVVDLSEVPEAPEITRPAPSRKRTPSNPPVNEADQAD